MVPPCNHVQDGQQLRGELDSVRQAHEALRTDSLQVRLRAQSSLAA